MKARRALILAALLAVGSIVSAQADDAAARRQLEDNYVRFVDAYKAKDINGVMALATPDFSVKQTNGRTMTRKQVEADLGRNFASTQFLAGLSLRIRQVTVKGNQAIAQKRLVATRIVTDPQGKVHRLVDNTVSRDIWTKTAGGWKVKRSEEVSRKMTMDGKPHPR